MGSRGGSALDGEDAASEFPWGPSHPCFPHPNPHVPLDTELYHNTRVIRIKRDWMMQGDLAPTFANLYPEILDPLITEDDFRILIKKVNDTLTDAFDPFTFRAWLDSFLGIATFWLWEDMGLTNVKRKLVDLERWLEDWNREVGEKEGVKIISLRRTGYLTVCIPLLVVGLGIMTDKYSSTYKSQIPISAPIQARDRTRRKTNEQIPHSNTNNTFRTRSRQRCRSIRNRRPSSHEHSMKSTTTTFGLH